MSRARRAPVSTYRLQFHRTFRFADARDLVPYLAELGATECYSSPHLRANPGSTHGYDICDHGQLNPELGTDAEFDAFCAALQAHGLGHIFDYVPNHMACDPKSNPWWRDVLENGESSPFATYFDIDWDPIKPELKGKVLLAVLGDQYGRVLERGELQLRFEEGALQLTYGTITLPINPRQAPRVLGLGVDQLERELEGDESVREYLSILTALQNLPPHTERDRSRIVERQREKEVARGRLARLVNASPRIRTHVEACVRLVNGVSGDRASFDRLHDLLEHQAYRLAYWRTAFDEINYRRFFDINELVGLRMEEAEVFEATHRLLARLIASGRITGIRVDHPDGLFNPEAYFHRLQQMARAALRDRKIPEAPDEPFYIVAEKILSAGESLQQDWPISGTTGYRFLNLASGLFVDSRHAQRLRRIYMRLTGRQETFEEVAYHGKRTIMLTAMAGELNVLAHALKRISERNRRFRDYTLNSCRKVLREVIACFPVYRTYVSERGVSEFDREAVEAAVNAARRRNPLMEASIFDFVRDILLAEPDASVPPDDPVQQDRLRLAMKVQQFTGPVQAKGVEDTAFYRYHVLVAANDVGGHPGRLGVSIAEFHDANRQCLANWPLEMIATSTHDTKRGEDARMRINAISEIPDAWYDNVSLWMRLNGRHRSKIGTAWAPDRNDEYLFYQALVGAWPAEAADTLIPSCAPAGLVQRLSVYMQKAAREAKVHTSWIDENQAYGRAVARFVEQTLTGRTAERFLRSFAPFQRRVARVGALNTLSQLVLKLASPGVADFYQGSELWDLSLVDPDNRRPVNFARRRSKLGSLLPLIRRVEGDGAIDGELGDLLEHWHDGRIKLFVTACGLRLRRRQADLVRRGAYVPLESEGPAAEHVVAFARQYESATLLAIVPRLVTSLVAAGGSLHFDERGWDSTRLLLPETLAAGCWRHAFTGETIDSTTESGGSALPLARVFRTSPVALLWAFR